LLGAFASCGGPSRDIVGKWRTSDDPNAVVWEFSSNGAVVIGSSRGRYSFGDNNRVKIEMPFGTSVYQMEFTRPDHMTFRESTGSKLTLTRVR
jgi:hypothetical protein